MTVDIEAIGVSVDTSGVKSGTSALDAFGRSADSASRKADDLGVASSKTSKSTQELGKSAESASRKAESLSNSNSKAAKETDLFGQSLARARAAIGEADNATLAFINGLERQIATYGKSRTEVARYEASLLGATKSQREHIQALLKTSEAQESSAKTTSSAAIALRGYAAAAISVGSAIGLAKKAVEIADEYTKLTGQLKLATRGHEEYAQAFENVQRVSSTAQVPLEETAKLYARISNATRELGAKQKDVADITEAVSLAMKVSGATSAEAASAMLQLSQSFGSGVLRGEEFNAVNEAAPRLMKALADGMGVPIGALRNMASDGKITSDVLGNALIKSLADLRKEAEKMQTVSGGITSVKNEFVLLVGEIDQATGASKRLADRLKEISSFVKDIRSGNSSSVMRGVANTMSFGLFGDLSDLFSDGSSASGRTASGKIKYGNQTDGPLKALPATFSDLTKELKLTSVQMAEYLAEKNKIIEAASREHISTAVLNDALEKLRAKYLGVSKAAEDFSIAEMGRMKQLLEADEREIESAKRQLDNQSKAIDAMAREAAGWKDLTEVQQVSWEIQSGRYRDFDEQSKEELLRLAGIIDLKKEQVELDKQDAELMKQLRAAEDEAVDETIRQLKKEQDAYQKMADNINRAITDSLMRGFERGKSFAQNFRDTLVNMFKTLVLQPTISYILSPVSGAIAGVLGSGAANAGQGSSGGVGGGVGISTLKDLYGAVTNGFDSMNIAFEQGIQSLGTKLVDFGFDKLGGMISQYSATISNVLPFLPTAISLLSGDIKGAVSSGIGAGIGFAIGGPVGAGIGSAIGSFVGGMFGSHVSRPKWYANTNVSAKNLATTSAWGNSDASGANLAVDPGMALGGSIQAIAKQLGGSINNSFILGTKYMQKYNTLDISVGREIGKSGNDINGIDMGSESARSNAAAMTFFLSVQRGFVKLDGYLQNIINRSNIGLDNALASANALATIKATKESLANLPPIFKSIGWTIDHTITTATVGRLQNRLSAISTYYSLFYSDSEKIADQTKALTTQFTKLGVTLPTTRDGFRSLVDGIDTTKASGVKLFDSLVDLAPTMDSYYKALQQQADATAQAAAAANQLAESLSTSKFKSLVDYLRGQSYIRNGYSTAGIPGFADGGDFSGGLRIVGENGPEIEATGPSRITNTNELMSRLRDPQANNAAVVAELKALRSDMRSMQVAQTIANQKTAKILDKFDNDGLPPTRT